MHRSGWTVWRSPPSDPGLTKNDYFFEEGGFSLHLSCSDPFTDGWGQSAGPDEFLNPDWQIDYFSIARYKQGGVFFRNCGNVVDAFEVPNTATVEWEDSLSSDWSETSDEVRVTIKEGIVLDRVQTNGKRVTARLTNYTGESRIVEEVIIEWPNEPKQNGNLQQIRLEDTVVWKGSLAGPSQTINGTTPGWNGGTLLPGEAILRFDFKNKVEDTGYTIRVLFVDGTFLDINQ